MTNPLWDNYIWDDPLMVNSHEISLLTMICGGIL